MKHLDFEKLKTCDRISREDAFSLIDDAIDTFIEADNGATEDMLREAVDKLLIVRDCYIDKAE